MNLTLFLGDFAYSSWSLRGWLLLDAFGIPFQTRFAHMRTPDFEALQQEMSPARLVPAVRFDLSNHSDVIVWDSLSIAETLAEHWQDAGHWPKEPAARAVARSVSAEMHSGFMALRGACPMNMRRAYTGFKVEGPVQADLARLNTVWTHARSFAEEGPYLFGKFTAADAFFAPVASRIATYDLPVSGFDADYVAALLAHPSVQRWYAKAKHDPHVQSHYEFDLPSRPNPHDQ